MSLCRTDEFWKLIYMVLVWLRHDNEEKLEKKIEKCVNSIISDMNASPGNQVLTVALFGLDS